MTVQEIQPSDAQKVMVALRGGAIESGLGKRIFSQGNSAVSDAEILSVLQSSLSAAGIQLPQGVALGLSGAQMLFAGGAFVSDIGDGASILQCASASGLALQSVASFLNAIGVGGFATKQLSDFGGLAGNLALAISSGGANILADLGTVISLINVVGDIGVDFTGSQAQAVYQAKKGLSSIVNAALDPQIAYATSQLSLYQSGSLNPFDLIGNIALNSPALFKNFFPSLACYFPSWLTETYTSTGYSSGLFSSHTDTERASFVELVTNQQQIDDVLIQAYIVTPMRAYFWDFYPSDQISLQALSVLAMILSSGTQGAVNIGFDFDILSAMQGLGLTPAILGDSFLFQGRLSHSPGVAFDPSVDFPYSPLTLSPPAPGSGLGSGLVISGVESPDPAQNYAAKLKQFQLDLYFADQYGDMDTLMANPESRAWLEKWAKIRIIPDFTTSAEPKNLVLKSGSAPISSQSWFDLNTARAVGGTDPRYVDYIRANYLISFDDYWKCLSLIDVMKKANLFKNISTQNQLDQYGSSSALKLAYKKAMDYVTAKALNMAARDQIGGYFGVSGQKLGVRYDSSNNPVYYVRGSNS